MKYPKISSIFIIFIIAHLNLIMPVSKASKNSDICIMDSGIHTAHHSDNHKIHDHRGESHHSGHQNGIYKIKTACNMDMLSSDIYFPGGEHPFINIESQEFDFNSRISEAVFFIQAQITEGFITSPYNPPRFIS